MTGRGRSRGGRRSARHYEICVGGVLGGTLRGAFPGLRVHVAGGDSVLEGEFDQAALYGLLFRLEALGLELIDVRRLA